MNPTIVINDLTTGYGSVRKTPEIISSGLNGTLMPGQLTCLIGPNGAGKSTLLRTLSGFQDAVSGEVKVNGVSISVMSRRTKASQLGVVLTDRPQMANTTVEELVALGRSPHTGFFGAPGSADVDKVDDAIRLVGIEHLRSRRLPTLSDGERQKAMIAKVIAQETPVIFLDEPTAFLDYPGKVEILTLLRRLAREEGKTVFLSTHDLEIALRIADTAWLLDRKHGLTAGTPSALAAAGELRRYFPQLAGTEFDPTLIFSKECR